LTEFENDMVNNESNIFISESEDFNLGLYLKSHFDINDIKYINFDKIALLGYLKNLTFSLGVENLNLKLDTLPQIIYVNNILTHDLSDKTKLHIGGSIGVNLHTKNIEYAKFLSGVDMEGIRSFLMVWGIRSYSSNNANELYPTLKFLFNDQYTKNSRRNIELELYNFESSSEPNQIVKTLLKKKFNLNVVYDMDVDEKTNLKFKFGSDLLFDMYYYRNTGFCKFRFNTQVNIGYNNITIKVN